MRMVLLSTKVPCNGRSIPGQYKGWSRAMAKKQPDGTIEFVLRPLIIHSATLQVVDGLDWVRVTLGERYAPMPDVDDTYDKTEDGPGGMAEIIMGSSFQVPIGDTFMPITLKELSLTIWAEGGRATPPEVGGDPSTKYAEMQILIDMDFDEAPSGAQVQGVSLQPRLRTRVPPAPPVAKRRR